MEEITDSIIVKTINLENIVLFGFLKNNTIFIFDTSAQNGYREASEIEIKHHCVAPELFSKKTIVFDILIWLKTNRVIHDLEIDINELMNIDELNIDSSLKKIMHSCLIKAKINKSILSNVHEEECMALKLVKDDIRWYFPGTWTKEWIFEKMTMNNYKNGLL